MVTPRGSRTHQQPAAGGPAAAPEHWRDPPGLGIHPGARARVCAKQSSPPWGTPHPEPAPMPSIHAGETPTGRTTHTTRVAHRRCRSDRAGRNRAQTAGLPSATGGVKQRRIPTRDGTELPPGLGARARVRSQGRDTWRAGLGQPRDTPLGAWGGRGQAATPARVPTPDSADSGLTPAR